MDVHVIILGKWKSQDARNLRNLLCIVVSSRYFMDTINIVFFIHYLHYEVSNIYFFQTDDHFLKTDRPSDAFSEIARSISAVDWKNYLTIFLKIEFTTDEILYCLFTAPLRIKAVADHAYVNASHVQNDSSPPLFRFL